MYWPTLRGPRAAGHVAGPLVRHARIAALCREHSMPELWWAGWDFGRFAGLTMVNLLSDRMR